MYIVLTGRILVTKQGKRCEFVASSSALLKGARLSVPGLMVNCGVSSG